MMTTSPAIWALTPGGAELALRLTDRLPAASCFLSSKIARNRTEVHIFNNFKATVAENFSKYSGHIFIMAAGIVVRTIAPYLRHKTQDPAVVVMDEAGRFAVSLVSGHIGGANELAETAARITGGQAVITTATDVNQIPAIDLLAKQKNLGIENPDAIKAINMALLTGQKIAVYDPHSQIGGHAWPILPQIVPGDTSEGRIAAVLNQADAGVFIDDKTQPDLGPTVLVLRPPSLAVGMGCNRNTTSEEMQNLLGEVFDRFKLSLKSIATLASVDLKADETGLLELARQLNLDLTCFTRKQLEQIENVPTPSAVVNKHIGVNSVCEAAAILGARMGCLIVPKQKSLNATLAIARRDFIS